MQAEWTLPTSSTLRGRGVHPPRDHGVGKMKFEGRLQGREIKPRSARIDVAYDAQVHCGEGTIEARILNVSNKGFLLHAAEELEPGMEVLLEVEKLDPVRGQIRWTCGQESGGVFLEAIAL